MVLSIKPFECHVTLNPKNALDVESIALQHNFHTSLLVGDDVMGSEKLLYATSHDITLDAMKRRMQIFVAALEQKKIPILRKKIEHIVYDERM